MPLGLTVLDELMDLWRDVPGSGGEPHVGLIEPRVGQKFAVGGPFLRHGEPALKDGVSVDPFRQRGPLADDCLVCDFRGFDASAVVAADGH